MSVVIKVASVVANESAGFADVVLTLSAPSALSVQVTASTYDGSAIGFSNGDFTPLNPSVITFAPGETSKTLRIALRNDTVAEPVESFHVLLASPQNASLGDNVVLVTLAGNDQVAGTPAVRVSDSVVDEKDGFARFVLTLDRPAAAPVSVDVATVSGNATAGVDFTAVSATVTFAPGETTATVLVPIIDDALPEGDELFGLQLSVPVGLTIAEGRGTARIGASDMPAVALPALPVVSLASAVANEMQGYVDVVFSLSAPSALVVQVSLDSFNGTANDGTHYYGLRNGVLSFAPGETLASMRFALVDDGAAAPAQTFMVFMKTPLNAVIDGYGVVTIARNDQAAALNPDGTVVLPSVSVADVTVDEKSGVAAFVITLDRPASSLVTVAYTTAGGTATAGSDFTAQTGSVGFAPGETVRTVLVPITDDAIAETDEVFSLTLSAPVGAVLGHATAQGRITGGDSTAVATPVVSVESTVANEQAGHVDVVVRLSAPSTQQVQVTLGAFTATADAFSDGDFVSVSNLLLSFAPGETSTTVRLVLRDENLAEAADSLRIFLSSPVNAVIDGYGVVTIGRSDGATGTPTVSVADVTVDEKAGVAAFVITLDRPSSGVVTVAYATAAGTAAAGSDFTSQSGSVGFAPGETVRTVLVAITDDAIAETDEVFSLTLSAPMGAVLGNPTGQARITGNDALSVATPVVSVENTAANEDAGYVDVVVRLSAPSTQQVQVTLGTATATADAFSEGDFVSVSNLLLSFAPGETSTTVRLPLRDEGVVEAADSLLVVLSNPVSAVIDGYGVVTIGRSDQAPALNPDSTPILPSVSVANVAVDEKTGVAAFVITLDRPSSSAVTVAYSTVAGTAAAGSDFAAQTGSVGFAPGETVRTVLVAITDDAIAETDELFSLTLSAPVGAVLGNATAQGRITGNDALAVAMPVLSVESTVVNEDAGYADVIVRLSAPSTQQVQVSLGTATATADAFSEGDFVSVSSQLLSFAPGETSTTVRVVLRDEIFAEAADSLRIVLSSPVNAVIDGYGVVTIGRSDGATGIPTVSVADVTVDEKAGVAAFVITLDRPASSAVTVAYTTTGGTAAAGSDFAAQSGSVGFAPGETVRTVLVAITDDAIAESDEVFSLTLSAPVGAVLANATAQGRITGNDAPAVATPVLSVESSVVNEDAGYADVIVRLSGPSTQQVQVTLGLATATADAFSEGDFVSVSNQLLSFAPGETSTTVRVVLRDESFAEAADSLLVILSSPVGAVVDGYGVVTIGRSDQAPALNPGGPAIVPSVSVADVTVDEKAGVAAFVITLDRPSSSVVTVAYATTAGTATAGGDFTAQSGSVGFAPGETVRTVLVPITDDAIAETDELFGLTLSAPVGAVLANATAQGRITGNDAPAVATPVVSVESTVANEGAGYADVIVRLSAPSTQQVQVTLGTATATADAFSEGDFVSVSNQLLSFAPGETSTTVRVVLRDEIFAEAADSLRIVLSSPVNAVTVGYGVVTIGRSDGATGTPTVSVADVAVAEKAGVAAFVITLDRPSSSAVTVTYTTTAGTATAGSDFTAQSGSVGFAPGETVRTVLVPITDDATAEADEAFSLMLSAPVGAGLGRASANATIVANDAAPVATPSISVSNATANESQGYVDVVVRLSAPSTQLVQATLGTLTGTADAFSEGDFVSVADVLLSFAPGETSTTVRVPLRDEDRVDGTESFGVRLTNPVNATLGSANAVITIVERDGGPVAGFNDITPAGQASPLQISLRFNQNVTGLTADDLAVINGTLTSVTGSGDLYTVTITPPPNFAGEAVVTLRADAVLGPTSLPNEALSFGRMVDTLPPQVTLLNPADGAASVARDAPLEVTFNEPIALGSGVITLRTAAGAVVETFDVSASGRLAIFGARLVVTPSEPLRYDTAYQLVLASGTVADLLGNRFVGLADYDFTVQSPPNEPPVAANGSATVLEDAVLTGTLPAGSDANGDPIRYARVTDPALGTVVVNADGSYSYTPRANANGSDSFHFSVSDGRGGSNTYTQSISVTPVNDAPSGGVAIAGTASVGQVLTIVNTLADIDGLGAFSYQWLRAGVPIAGAVASSYTLVAADGGAAISVQVSYTDGGGTVERVASAAVTPTVAITNVVGTAGNDSLPGGGGADSITGLAGNDTLQGLAGNDVLEGGAGNDVLAGGAGSDTLNGGAGIDIADYRGSAAVNANLQTGAASQGTDADVLIAIEALFGSGAGDVLRGLDGPANLPGETVRGGGGNDSIDGGSGIDMAEFSGRLADYTIQRSPGTMNLTVSHNNGGSDGVDTLSNIELLLFSDRVVAFGPRAEEVARVAFALWSPAIVNSPTLFSKGLSFYTNEFGYNLDTLCQVALSFWSETGSALASKLLANAPGTTLTAAGLLQIMSDNGGGQSITGRAAAVKAVALDAATSTQLQLTGVLSNGVVATLSFPADPVEVYFGPLAG